MTKAAVWTKAQSLVSFIPTKAAIISTMFKKDKVLENQFGFHDTFYTPLWKNLQNQPCHLFTGTIKISLKLHYQHSAVLGHSLLPILSAG